MGAHSLGQQSVGFTLEQACTRHQALISAGRHGSAKPSPAQVALKNARLSNIKQDWNSQVLSTGSSIGVGGGGISLAVCHIVLSEAEERPSRTWRSILSVSPLHLTRLSTQWKHDRPGENPSAN